MVKRIIAVVAALALAACMFAAGAWYAIDTGIIAIQDEHNATFEVAGQVFTYYVE